MKKLMALALAAGALLIATPAEAHNQRWHWSARAAEGEIMAYYSDVVDVRCFGRGRSVRSRGRRLYKHFDCTLALDDGAEHDMILHVRGLKRFSTSHWS